MSQNESWRLRPGGELTDILDALPVHGPARDVLCFLAGRDAEAFALAVGYAAPGLLPERIRESVLDALNGVSL